MSRVGKLPIPVSSAVNVTLDPSMIVVEGPKGKLEQRLDPDVKVTFVDGIIKVVASEGVNSAAKVGLYRSLINNMVVGVEHPFEKTLEPIGVGYKVSIEGNLLIMSLGYSHDIFVDVPKDLNVSVNKNIIVVQGASKYHVGQFCATIRSFRKPEPYKGKGIRYKGERILRKDGKRK